MEEIADPRLILCDDKIWIVLSNQINSWIGKAIDFRTNISGPGMFPVDHMMETIDQGKFYCQGFTFKEIMMDEYLIPGGQLWFVELVNSNPAFVEAFRNSVRKRAALPAIFRMYDFLGIFGQAIGQPWIHTPFLDYCSVDVLSHLKDAAPALPAPDQALIKSIPNESNPELITYNIVRNPTVFNIRYSWSSPLKFSGRMPR